MSERATHRDLLVELGTEELPPGALRGLMDDFAAGVIDGLDRAGLDHSAHRRFASPRRLALWVEALALRQPDQPFERKGPSLQVAFDEHGRPTRAAEGFARSCGVAVNRLERLHDDKGDWLVHRGVEPGRLTTELLADILGETVAHMPVPKRMRWGDSEAEFVRPVHWLVVLLGDEVVPATLLGVASGRDTWGHRFHCPDPIALSKPADYEIRLKDPGHVIADLDRRRAIIRDQVSATGAELGGEAVIEPELLDEVTALVEWPVTLAGSFDVRFLRVPPEALISSMQSHQKYFPVRDDARRLMPRFITVANIDSRDPTLVVAGNERVIRPRLADAAFFWDRDCERSLSQRVEALRDIVFQKRLGSLHDKSARVAAIATELAETFDVDPSTASHAAWLAKTDLATEMVGEFPELQGTMARHYARHDGEAEAVAEALEEVYKPRFAGDEVAATALGQALAVAERADTLVGIFAIGKAPTGAKDPFALRRTALGLLRTLIESEKAVDLRWLFGCAAAQLPPGLNDAQLVEPVVEFCLDRLKGFYQEHGVATELIDAVRALVDVDVPIADPLDFDRRLHACRQFARLPEATRLTAANKRIRNILRKAEASAMTTRPDPNRFELDEEHALDEAMEELEAATRQRVAARQYTEALRQLASLATPVDRFFDAVLVMADDPLVRANRLALLARLSRLFLSIADVSRLPSAE